MTASPRIPDRAESLPSLIMVCDWLPPEFGAVGQYMLEFAEEAAARGTDALLIGLSHAEESTEERSIGAGRLTIRRLFAPAAPKGNLLVRGLWALRANLALGWAVHRGIRASRRMGKDKSGELIVTGSPPFLSTILLLLNRGFWHRKVTYRITDFYPETVLAAGKAPWLRLLLPLFRKVRALADTLEVLSLDQARRLKEQGFAEDRIVLRRDRSPARITPETTPLASPFEPGDCILLYSGNLGVAHPIEVFCEAYRRHIQTGSNRVRLWMNGQGVRVAELRAYCAGHGLPLHVTAPVPLEKLPGLLMAADAHLILLGRPFWGYVLPSKVYGCLESRKPILFVGPAESDIRLLMEQSGDPAHRQTETLEGCLAFLEAMAANVRARSPVPPQGR
jgi:colanic acid biosynthesis glycosyl transferase WcaI